MKKPKILLKKFIKVDKLTSLIHYKDILRLIYFFINESIKAIFNL